MKKLKKIFAMMMSIMLFVPSASFALTDNEIQTKKIEIQPVNKEHGDMYYSIPDNIDTNAYTPFEELSGIEMKAEPVLPAAGTYVEGELLVKLKRTERSDSALLQSAENNMSEYVKDSELLFSVESGVEGTELSSEGNEKDSWICVSLKENTDMLAAWKAISEMENVIEVEVNGICSVSEEETGNMCMESIMDSDPYIHSQFWLEEINAEAGWQDNENPGEGIVVAVIDSGVDMDHPDLKDNLMENGYDFVDDDDYPDDGQNHGTHVAGIIAACSNQTGVRGVAYGAKILPVRVLNSSGKGKDSDVAEGIIHAADNGADIINMSLGGTENGNLYEDAVRYARSKDCLVVAAAGNEGLPTDVDDGNTYGGIDIMPAAVPGVLTVMAADDNKELAYFSNYDSDPGKGREYEIMAPGVNILSTLKDGKYGRMSGTSMATPVVAGTAAILMGMGCDADSAFQIISSCTEKDAVYVDYSYPYLDMKECVEKAKKSTEFSIEPVITNLSVTASLEDIDFGHGPVCFDGTNTSGRLFFRSGKLKSSIGFSLENIGGSGNVEITGTVGGCPINSRTYFVRCGAAKADKLIAGGKETAGIIEFSGVPEVNSAGKVEILLYANGKPAYEGALDAYELKTPEDEGLTYEKRENCYSMGSDSIQISGNSSINTLLVIDEDVLVDYGQSLKIIRSSGNKRVALYEAEGKSIQVLYDSKKGEGSLQLTGLELKGYDYFTKTGFGNTAIYYCTLYKPHIEYTDYLFDSSIFSGGEDSIVIGYSIYECGFYYCDNAVISSMYFMKNMVNRCYGSELVSDGQVCCCTFVENFRNNDEESLMNVYVQDFTTSEKSGRTVNDGFFYNNVIGPMEIISNEDFTTPAKVYGVYYQKVTGPVHSSAPSGVEDTLTCSSDSTVSSEISDIEEWGFADISPAFVIKTVCGKYKMVSSSRIDYSADVIFSTEINKDLGAIADSVNDELIDVAKAEVSEDGKSLNITGSSIYQNADMVRYYSAMGFATASTEDSEMSWTQLYSQTTCMWPMAFDDYYYLSSLDSVSAEGDKDSRTVVWKDERLTEEYPAQIERSVDGGEYEIIANEISEKTYVDNTQLPENSEVSYRVTLFWKNNRVLKGVGSMLVPFADDKMGTSITPGEFINEKENSLALALRGKFEVSSETVFTFPGVKASRLEPGDALKNSGIAYGIINVNGDTAVYFCSKNKAVLPEYEELFRITVEGTDGEKTVSVKNDGVSQNWGKSDSVSYFSVDGLAKAAYSDDTDIVQLWNLGSGKVTKAEYDNNGRMISTTDVGNGSSSFTAPEEGKLKIFFTDDEFRPLSRNICLTGITFAK